MFKVILFGWWEISVMHIMFDQVKTKNVENLLQWHELGFTTHN